MAADPNRRPRDERFPADGGLPPDAEPAGAAGEETLAEKIRRYRQPGAGGGGAPGPAGRVVRKPREE